MACSTCKGERIIWGKDKYNRAVAINCPDCNLNGVAVQRDIKAMQRSESMDIIEVFWKNVDWHLKHKNLILSKTQMIAKNKRKSISLRTVGEIAKKLDIDDYSILFEQLYDEMASQ